MRLIASQSKNSISVDNYLDLIQAFSDYDCDTLDECVGICENFDTAYLLCFDSSDGRAVD